jgi:hypothetical protein
MANQARLAALLLSLAIAAPIIAQAQQPIARSWSGWARCQITIQAPGYSHRETHLWTITGAGTKNANMEIYPTSWTVTGDGSLQRVNGPTRVSAQWTVNGTLQNVTIGTTLHRDRITVQRWTNHGPARSALTGSEITTINGVGRSRNVVLDVQQWAFPAIVTGTTSTRATGSNTLPFDGLRGPLNPPRGAMGTAACAWDFARGGESRSASVPYTSRPSNRWTLLRFPQSAPMRKIRPSCEYRMATGIRVQRSVRFTATIMNGTNAPMRADGDPSWAHGTPDFTGS